MMRAYLRVPESAGFERSIPFDAKESLLPWQERGLQETASGYGRKLTSRYMVKVAGRWRRVYVCQIANAGTMFIGDWEYIVDRIEESE